MVLLLSIKEIGRIVNKKHLQNLNAFKQWIYFAAANYLYLFSETSSSYNQCIC